MYSEKDLKRFFNKLVVIKTNDKTMNCYLLGKDMEKKWRYLCMDLDGNLFTIARATINSIKKDERGN